MKSRIHPKYKTKYRVTNWAEYDQALVKRGDITLWISENAIDVWTPAQSGKRGAPRKYSDLAIETALTLRLVYGLPLRQAEGFLRSLLNIMGLDLDAPDHTTLSRRSRQLNIALKPKTSARPIDLIVDSTGLSIVGQGEWASAKHGKRGKRGWLKLHIGVNGDGEIVAQVLTDGNADDAKTGVELIEQVQGDIKSVIGDAAYDTGGIYEAAGARGAEVVVPPVRRAVVSRSKLPLSPRDKTVLKVHMMGRRKWKKESGYHRQGRVENTFFRYKQILGGKLRARHAKAQEVEAVLACLILNRMHALGMPKSVATAP
ncbi:MAG: IS5 family transposase [Planctomycetota bacterium]|jgi:IS5 family transposase